MTVPNTTNRNDYVGNGATSVYAYAFRILDEDDLTVTVRDTDGNETELVISTDYTVDGVGDENGGNVTLVDNSQAWLDAEGDLLTDYVLAIRRVVDLTQETDIRNQGEFLPEIHEDALDKLTHALQQVQDALDRSLKLPVTEVGTPAATFIPSPEERAGKILTFNAAGDPAVGTTIPEGSVVITPYAETLLDDATAAAARATLGFTGAGGTVPTAMIEDLAVTTAKLADLGVTTAKLADLGVTAAKIANLTITSGKIADNAVTSAKILDDAVITAKILDANVTTAKLAAGAVTNAKLSDTLISDEGTTLTNPAGADLLLAQDVSGAILAKVSFANAVVPAIIAFASTDPATVGSRSLVPWGRFSDAVAVRDSVDARTVMPFDCILKNLRVRGDANVTGSAYTATLRVNGVSTGLSATVAVGASTGSDLASEISVVAGDQIELTWAAAGGAGPTGFIATLEATKVVST